MVLPHRNPLIQLAPVDRAENTLPFFRTKHKKFPTAFLFLTVYFSHVYLVGCFLVFTPLESPGFQYFFRVEDFLPPNSYDIFWQPCNGIRIVIKIVVYFLQEELPVPTFSISFRLNHSKTNYHKHDSPFHPYSSVSAHDLSLLCLDLFV